MCRVSNTKFIGKKNEEKKSQKGRRMVGGIIMVKCGIMGEEELKRGGERLEEK